ncbi:MAG: endonuclease/exonuclease/phosphatase family protein [Actinomycetota bacterium]
MRVLTWNTLWQFGPWQPRQAPLDAACLAADPTVVLLQETWPGQAERLAGVLGMEVVGYHGEPLEPAPEPEAADTPFGNALLARPGTMSAADILILPPGVGRAVRSAVAAKTSVFGAEVLVVSTHLASKTDDNEARARQMHTIVEWVDGLHPDGPVLLGGDLNQTPTSPEYVSSIAPNWADLWLHDWDAADGGPGGAPATVDERVQAGLTMIEGNPHVLAGEWMLKRNGRDGPANGVRFDYLLARAGGAAGLGPLGIEWMTTVGAAPDAWPSDHLGVLAEITPS